MWITDRSFATSSTRRSLRARLNVVAVGAALAFMAGLSGAAGADSDAARAESVTLATTPSAAAVPDPFVRAEKAGRSAAERPNAAPAKPAAKPAPAKAAKPKAAKPKAAQKAKAPSQKQLHPRGIPGGQQSFTPSKEQLRNAKAIVDTGKKMKLPPRAWVIAVATATQESTLRNLGHLGASNDHDSQGLFQQRPSSGWGSPKQVTNPEYASTAFYKALKRVDGWEKMPLTRAAQKVQVSAYPDHYAKWERLAGDIVRGLHGEGPHAKAAANLK